MIDIPEISKQIYSEDTFGVLEKKYSTLGPLWVSHQVEWNNGIYASFKDHDKFMIIIFLTKKTLEFYSRNFIKLTFDDFYSKNIIEIEKFTIKEISQALSIPKESTRRKVQELYDIGAIKKIKKKTIIDRSNFYYSKPVDSIKRVSRFLSILSEMCKNEKVLPDTLTSEQLELIIKKNFSYIWLKYYELQIPMMISYKEIFTDLETFHIFGVCIVNQHLGVKKINENLMNRDNFIKILVGPSKVQGVNAMSISDITGIPRATVIRKLKKMIELNFLTIDDKKLYRLSGKFSNRLKPTQKNVFIKLASFSAKIFNLVMYDKIENAK